MVQKHVVGHSDTVSGLMQSLYRQILVKSMKYPLNWREMRFFFFLHFYVKGSISSVNLKTF